MHRARLTLALLAGAILATPLLFFPLYYKPFDGAKVVGFLTLVSIALPFYLASFASHDKPLNRLRHPITLTLVAFTLVLTISAALGIDPWNSFLGSTIRPVGVLYFIFGLLAVFYLQEVFSLRESWKRNLTTIVIAAGSIIASYALVEGWLLPSFVDQEGRIASFMGNPIFLASFLMLPLAFCSMRAFDRSETARTLYRVLCAVMGLAILLTGTRGAFVGLIAGGLFWIVAAILRKHTSPLLLIKKTIISVLAVAAIILTLSLLPGEQAVSRLIDYGGTNVSARLEYWQMGLRAWQDAPILGLGPGNFYRAADQYFTERTYESTDSWADKPHNIAIEWLATTGAVGFILYVLLLALLYREAWHKHDDRSLILLAGLTAYIVQGLFVFHTVSELLTFWFLIAWLSHPTSADRPPTNRWKLSIAAVAGAALGLAGLFLYAFPYHQLLYTIGQGHRYQEQEPMKALAFYQQAASLPILLDDTVVSRMHLNVVNAMLSNQDVIDLTIAEHRRSLARHPLKTRLWNDIAFLYYLRATLNDEPVSQEGLEAAQRAVELAPGRIEPRRMLATILVQNGELERAEEIARELITQVPSDTSPHYILSQIAYKRGDMNTAAQEGFQAAMGKIDNARLEEVLWLAGLLEAQKDFGRIIAMFEAWVDSHPDDPALLPNLAAAYAAVGDRERAIETAQRYKTLDPASAAQAEEFIKHLE